MRLWQQVQAETKKQDERPMVPASGAVAAALGYNGEGHHEAECGEHGREEVQQPVQSESMDIEPNAITITRTREEPGEDEHEGKRRPPAAGSITTDQIQKKECMTCKEERRTRRLVAQERNDVIFSSEAFVRASAMFANNDLKYEVNMLCPAKDTPLP